MTLLRVLLLLLAFFVTGIPSVHYHRYMLSDYRPQHSNKTQMDYRPIPRPTYPKITPRKKSAETLIKLLGSEREVQLQDLLVRVYNGKQLLCHGIIVSNNAAIIVGNCLENVNPQDVTVKSMPKKKIELKSEKELDESDRNISKDMSPFLKLLPLKTEKNMTARFCSSVLKPNAVVPLITYKRSNRTILTQSSIVLPLSECRSKMQDSEHKLLTDEMICVKNENKGICKDSMGLPLIHNGEICGISLLGHNCPKYIGFDLYVRVLNEADYLNATLKRINSAKIEDSMF